MVLIHTIHHCKTVVDLRGQLKAVAPPSPSLNRSGAPFWKCCALFEELTFYISVEVKTPPLSTVPFKFALDPPLLQDASHTTLLHILPIPTSL